MSQQFIVELDGAPDAEAVVAAVHQLERSGVRVLRLVEPAGGDPLVSAANAVLRLRDESVRVSEHDLVELLELLPV